MPPKGGKTPPLPEIFYPGGEQLLVHVAGDVLQHVGAEAVAVGHLAQVAAVGAGKSIFRIITHLASLRH